MAGGVDVAAAPGRAGSPGSGAPPYPVPASPPASRFAPPRWRDARLLAGVLLVLVSVVVGARLVSAARRTVGLVAAARPLQAGHVLVPGDLAVVQAHAPSGTLTGYWPGQSTAALLGRPVRVPLTVGELVARNAVGTGAAAGPARVVSVPVDPARLADAAPGDLVDVFVTYKGTGASGSGGSTQAVARGVQFLGTGGSSAGGALAVRLLVPTAVTGPLVRASELGSLDVVRQQPAGTDAGSVGSAPLTGP